MLGLHGAGAFQHGQEADDVGVDVGLGIFDAVADAGLGPEVDDAAGRVLREQGGHAVAIRQIERVVDIAGPGQQAVEARLFEGGVIVVIEIVDADHRLAARQQTLCGVEADETGRTGDEDGALGGHGFAIAPVGPLRHLISIAGGRSGRKAAAVRRSGRCRD